MIDSEFLDELKKLNLITRKKVSSVYLGSRSSIKQGRGMELYDHREYYTGDDFRAIDWKLYGRIEKLYIRRFEEEKDFTLHLLVDGSSSMDFSTTKMRKFDYAGSIAAGFAFIAMHRYEKFAPALYSDKILEIMQPNKGKMQFFRMIELMNTSKLRGVTNLGESMSQYSSYIKTKSFMIVVSDFLEPIESLRKGIYRVAKGSKEAMLIQVLDPGEVSLKWTDDIDFEDLETTKSEKVYLSPNFKKDYHKKFMEHIFAIREICEDTGVDFFSVSTDKPLFDAFVGILDGKMNKGGFEWEKNASAEEAV
jgi:uncharacterized protein (DUF58 family)